MFDKKTHLVLNYLVSQCPGGAFKILEKQDIADAMPPKLGITAENLDGIIGFLQESEYLILKYVDDVQICVALAPKAHSALLHNAKFVEKPKSDKKIYWIVGVVAFLGAFLGTVAAGFFGF